MADRAEKSTVTIKVPSKDPKQKGGADAPDGDDGVDKDYLNFGGETSDRKEKTFKKGRKGGKDTAEPEELSEEDKALKEGLELAVTRVEDTELGIGE